MVVSESERTHLSQDPWSRFAGGKGAVASRNRMGAALASHGLHNPQLQRLLGEYTRHTRTTADECAAIFRGERWDDPSDVRDSYRIRRYSGSSTSSLGYPRRLQIEQFDEVFGMLVADVEPHFAFFRERADTKTTRLPAVAIAHQVFCAVALLLRADLRSQMDFVLRMYADASGRFSVDAKRMLLKDWFESVERLLQLTEPIPKDAVALVEVCDPTDQLVLTS